METVRQDPFGEGQEGRALDLRFLQPQVEHCGRGAKHGHQQTLYAGRGRGWGPDTAGCPPRPGPHGRFEDRSSPHGSRCRFTHTDF